MKSTVVFDDASFFTRQGLPGEIIPEHCPTYVKGLNQEPFFAEVLGAFNNAQNAPLLFCFKKEVERLSFPELQDTKAEILSAYEAYEKAMTAQGAKELELLKTLAQSIWSFAGIIARFLGDRQEASHPLFHSHSGFPSAIESVTKFLRLYRRLGSEIAAWVRHRLSDEIGVGSSSEEGFLCLNSQGKLVPLIAKPDDDIYTQALKKKITESKEPNYFESLTIWRSHFYDCFVGRGIEFSDKGLNSSAYQIVMNEIDEWLSLTFNLNPFRKAMIELKTMADLLNELFTEAAKPENDPRFTTTECKQYFLKQMIIIAEKFAVTSSSNFIAYLEYANTMSIVPRCSRIKRQSKARKFLKDIIDCLRKRTSWNAVKYQDKTWEELRGIEIPAIERRLNGQKEAVITHPVAVCQ